MCGAEVCLGEKTHTFGVLGDLLGDPGWNGPARPTGHTHKVPMVPWKGHGPHRNLSGPRRADSVMNDLGTNKLGELQKGPEVQGQLLFESEGKTPRYSV